MLWCHLCGIVFHLCQTIEDSSHTSSSQPTPPQHNSSAGPKSLTTDVLGGIDPELAFLDPSLAQAQPSTSSTTPSYVPTFTAKFSARTGKFSGASSRDPSHVSEYERAKRMSEAYFDVEAWQKEITERDAAKKRAAEEAELTDVNANQKRKPTKADIVCFSGLWRWIPARIEIFCVYSGKVEGSQERKEAAEDCMVTRMTPCIVPITR